MGQKESRFKPIMLVAPKAPDDFGDISLSKAVVGKYLKESCLLKLLQLSLK